MFSNPKRVKRTGAGKDAWFDYYAGFSSSFVRTVLDHLGPNMEGPVLDPWNGSGTTTTTAYELGLDSTGVDINPVMAVVAKAKLLAPGVQESLIPLAEEIVTRSRDMPSELRANEPLLEWFSPLGALGIRSLEQTIRKLLTPLDISDSISTSESMNSVSDLAAFFIVALFRTARSFLGRFQASNPTWIKSPKTKQGRLRPKAAITADEFLNQVRIMIKGVVPTVRGATATISLGSSERLPVPSSSVQAVIASPPYCTRIDYAVATKTELAILGFSLESDFKALRHQMLGGPVVSSCLSQPDDSWGPSCLELLRKVQLHPTKGSEKYYHKIFLQYYASIRRSLQEINRTLIKNGHCILVVQDSHYKELHVDIARHITEMALFLGWLIEARQDFETRIVRSRMNPKARKYRTHTGATESVLWFRTPA